MVYLCHREGGDADRGDLPKWDSLGALKFASESFPIPAHRELSRSYYIYPILLSIIQISHKTKIYHSMAGNAESLRRMWAGVKQRRSEIFFALFNNHPY